ncbi:MAG: UPF0262 family protein [Rhodobacteraceae bacterium]|nr:UPF0262 family protein [Paracoccaceae bacterium]
MSRLSDIIIDCGSKSAPPPEVEQEQRTAVFDLLEDNSFALPSGGQGPFRLTLRRDAGRLSFDLQPDGSGDAESFQITLGGLRQIVKDYAQICASYYDAVKTEPPARIEALDEARRDIHREGARVLSEKLEGKAEMDEDTARRLFTLVCAMTDG